MTGPGVSVRKTSPAPRTVVNHPSSKPPPSWNCACCLPFAVHQHRRSPPHLGPCSPERRRHQGLARPCVDQRTTVFPRSSVWRAESARSAARRPPGAALRHRRREHNDDDGADRKPFGFQPLYDNGPADCSAGPLLRRRPHEVRGAFEWLPSRELATKQT